MSWHIKAGTRVTIRPPNAKPTAWRSHEMRMDLQLAAPLITDRSSYLFEYRGWSIRVAKHQVDVMANAKSA